MKSKNYKFVRCVSVFALVVTIILDAACAVFSVYAISALREKADFWGIAFVVIMLFSDVLGVLFTKETLSNGVKFFDDYVEFTGIDENNVYKYSDIERIETSRDTKASFRKNFVDRYSNVTLYLKDESVVCIQLGLTSGKTLKKITDELTSHL